MIKAICRAIFILGLTACGGASENDAPTVGGSAPEATTTADTVLLGGAVYTMNPSLPWAEAVAITDGRISHVGDRQSIQAFVGDETTAIELQDEMVLPGFVDAHSHYGLGASFALLIKPPLTLASDISWEETEAAIVSYAEENPDLPMIFGVGNRLPPSDKKPIAALNRLIPDRPAFFIAEGYHWSWFNTHMADLAGVSSETPNPVPGAQYFVRDEDGELTGTGMDVLGPFIAKVIEALARKDNSIGELPREMAFVPAMGITTAFDANTQSASTPHTAALDVLLQFAKTGALPFRMSGSVSVQTDADVEPAIERLKSVNEDYRVERFQIRTLKIFTDGSDIKGGLIFPQETLDRLVTEADAAGFSVHLHVTTADSSAAAIDAIEAAIEANGPKDRRHTLAHVEVIRDAEIERAADLGVIISSTGNWTRHDEVMSYAGRLGREFLYEGDGVYRFGTMIDRGVTFTLGSDFPVFGPSWAPPLANIQTAVTRRDFTDPDAPASPKDIDRLTVEEAIAAYTLNGAYQLGLENEIGSIEIGKRADLVVLDTNLFEIPAEEIYRTKVLMTFVDGSPTFGGKGPTE